MAEQRPHADSRCIPIRLDRTPPQGDEIESPSYTDEDHETWRLLYARQRALLCGRAADPYLAGLTHMGFPEDRVPSLRSASAVLSAATGWRIARIPGLLHEEDFFAHLARRVFPSTDYIRARHEMDYTPAPDLFHDVFGHLPLITHPAFADFYQRLGSAACSARGNDRRRLERFYWFTVEFGLIRTREGLRIYGNGILSSRAETLHSLTDAVVKLPFDPDRIAERDYDVSHLQPLLFVIDSFEQLAEEFETWARRRAL
jgi:phenylalanine-4-hydroxylase